jgi:hypothetical protein
MSERPKGAESSCESFLEQLESLPWSENLRQGNWQQVLPGEVRDHAAQCASCEEALADFVDTREALVRMRGVLPQPGPWFVTRVMATIREREKELQEQAESVWVSIMKLAPRLSMVAAVLLLVGGSWALQLRYAERARQNQSRPVEGLFETAPHAPLNDDIVAAAYEGSRP